MDLKTSFQNPDLPLEDRIDLLMGELTLAEKCSLMRYKSPAIERLGIPAYNWWNEALHGVGRNGRATVFPQAIGMAATWNPDLIEKVASATSDEARAKHHEAARRGFRQQYQGLTFWSPNINIFRDPRWGRGQETWGEDPFLTGEMGAAFVQGMQGHDPDYLKTAACAKHYAVHSGPEALRHEFDAQCSLQDLWETYLPAFKRLVEAEVEAFMGAYNRTLGEPCCGSKFLMMDILRDQWKFKGHYVSDCWAIQDFHLNHKVTGSAAESAALAVKTGCDLNCGDLYCSALEDALITGLLREDDVDTCLKRLLRTLFKLGFFDPEDRIPYASIPMEVVDSPEHHQTALRAARESLVLLKNRDQILPISPETPMILVTGPHYASVEALLGNYFGMSSPMITLIEGLVEQAPPGIKIESRKGCLMERDIDNDKDWAPFEAAKADLTIAAMGLDANFEGEEGDAIQSPHRGDREHIELPENQVRYIQNMRKAIEEGDKDSRLVVLLFGGCPMAAPEIHEAADAVIWVGYPGAEGGRAIAEVLFGTHAPSGRLPFTVPRSTADLPPYEEYAMEGRTYKYMQESKMLYPFGFGLTYGSVQYSELDIAGHVEDGFTVTCQVNNPGTRSLKEVVQVYSRSPEQDYRQPQFKLLAFDKVELSPGSTKKVTIEIPTTRFADVNPEGKQVLASGTHRVFVGGSVPLERCKELGAAAWLEGEVIFSETV